MTIYGISIYDSVDEEIFGHGISCEKCLDFQVYNSHFSKLVAMEAAAIIIKDQMGVRTIIEGCTFEGN